MVVICPRLTASVSAVPGAKKLIWLLFILIAPSKEDVPCTVSVPVTTRSPIVLSPRDDKPFNVLSKIPVCSPSSDIYIN